MPNFDANDQFTGVTDAMSYLPGIGEKELSNGAITYYHLDQVGSLRVATDATGNVVGRYVYTAFGELVYEDGGSIGVPPVDSRYGYAGEFGYQEAGATDPLSELGWLHVGHRYYDPSAGRFMQRDPIGIRGGWNTYEYCDNDSASSIDPEGLVIINDRRQKSDGTVLIHYYDKGPLTTTYLRTVCIPGKGTTKGNSEGTEKDAENAIKQKEKADADVVGRGQEEINKNKNVTKDYLNAARKGIPKLPKP